MLSVSIEVKGADKLAHLGAALKDAGAKDLRKELLRAMQRSGAPMKAAGRAAAATQLPQHGGLARRVAGSKFAVRTRTAGKGAGLRVVGRGNVDLPGLDRGRVRHPVYGNRNVWVDQRIIPGWWTAAMRIAALRVRPKVVKAIDAVAAKLKARA